MDILSNQESEYNKLLEDYKSEYSLRTAHIKTDEDLILHDHDYEFIEWSDGILLQLDKILKKEIIRCNKNNVFFRGCNFKNYESNYGNRVAVFLREYEDAEETDFIESEVQFYKHLISNLQSQSNQKTNLKTPNKDDFFIAKKIIEATSKKQVELSSNKIIEFLESKKNTNPIEHIRKVTTYGLSLFKLDLKSDGLSDNQAEEIISNMRKELKPQLDEMLNSFDNPIDKFRFTVDTLIKLYPKVVEGNNYSLENQIKRMANIDFLAEAKEQTFTNQLVDENTDTTATDFVKDTILDYLDDVKKHINEADYSILVEALYRYFTTGEFPQLNKKINFKRVNKKKVGWALKETFKNIKQGNLVPEYFKFAQENINLFESEIIETENFNNSKFYKLFTTNVGK